MTKEVNFYQIDDVLAKSIGPLMLKMLEEGKKALILCQDPQDFEEVDAGLWTFGKFRFIPHVTVKETDIEKISTWERQPVVISDQEENKNSADYLVLTDDCSDGFLEKFPRIFYFYDSTMIDKVKKFAKKFGGNYTKKSYKKIKGKWEGFDL